MSTEVLAQARPVCNIRVYVAQGLGDELPYLWCLCRLIHRMELLPCTQCSKPCIFWFNKTWVDRCMWSNSNRASVNFVRAPLAAGTEDTVFIVNELASKSANSNTKSLVNLGDRVLALFLEEFNGQPGRALPLSAHQCNPTPLYANQTAKKP